MGDPIFELLARAKTIAVVGLSDNPMRPSYGVSAYMQSHGYQIIPVNPQIAEALGETSYPSLLDVPIEVAKKIDLVDVFRRAEFGRGPHPDQKSPPKVPPSKAASFAYPPCYISISLLSPAR